MFPLCDRLGRLLGGTIAFSPGLVSSSDVATPDLFNWEIRHGSLSVDNPTKFCIPQGPLSKGRPCAAFNQTVQCQEGSVTFCSSVLVVSGSASQSQLALDGSRLSASLPCSPLLSFLL